AAVRAARWRGGSVAFPGLAERAGTPAGRGSAPGASGTATAPSTASPTA
ncbi:DUF4439 domain-containing protein, partial [Streptomyces diastaticus]|nr:DUF4439 domain-containing protein [Streptomyces diastaticus]